MEFSQLKSNLKKDFSPFKTKLKVALMGDSPTQLLRQALKGYGYEVAVDYDIFESDFDQIDQQILDPTSELYQSASDYIVVFPSVQKLQQKFYKKAFESRRNFAAQYIEYVSHLAQSINGVQTAKIIFFNFPELNDSVFGNYANKTESSFLYQIRKINMGLMDLSRQIKNLFINDLSSLQADWGNNLAIDPKFYVNTGMVLTLDFMPAVVKSVTDIILSIHGRFKKCLILDLDNTTWGGIIGDDGVEGIQIGDLGIGKAFTQLQTWAKELKERGIILCVCSKNTESIAKEPFEKHPDMVLRLSDIAVFVANWENKVDNIRHIQSVLNIGFDSMVFLDDNPFERNMVRMGIPDMTVPELPEDPAEYLPYLRTLNLFETASFSAEDKNRTEQYQVEAQRVSLQKSFANEDEFLENLSMTSKVSAFDKFSLPRIAQLSIRSNQFNLRTIRYTEQDIENLIQDPDYDTLYFTLDDKYGEYGLISLIILKKLDSERIFIETWLMSCRVLKRGMEGFVLNNIIKLAREKGFKTVVGEYIPTPKNDMVREHYKNLGFTEQDGKWTMDVASYEDKKNFILATQK
jgi:FkbH-like protein